MAPQIDWNQVLSVDISLLQDDEEYADKLFHDLAEVEVYAGNPEAGDATKMVQLFKVTQSIMKVKNIQYEATLDELENVMRDGAGTKEKDLMAEIDALHKDLAHYQKFSNSDDRFLKAEMEQLEDKNKLLEKELEELERKLVKEQHQNDKVTKQCEELELKNTELKREGDRLRSNIKDYQRQLESQRENQILRRGEDMSVKDQISNKNKELSRYLDEIRDLQNENDSLQKDINIAQKELKDASVAMNEMADDYAKLKSVLEDRDILLERSRQEGDLLRAQVQDLQLQVQSKDDVDDEIMVAFNKKVEEWKGVLAAKDEELLELNRVVVDLQNRLQAARMDTDKNAVAELIAAGQEKDEKIKELRKSLEEATREMKLVTERIEDVKEKSKKDGGPSLQQQSKIASLSQTLQNEQLMAQKEKEFTIKLESDVIEKDKIISELRARMMQYELGQFGLPEAVQEIKEFRTQIKIRDKNIEDLTKNLNQIQMELNDVGLENEELRERLGMDPKQSLDAGSLRKKKQIREEQALALNRTLAREVERLEEERINLKKMLRKQAMHRGERAVELGITTEDLEAVEESALNSEPVIKPVHVQHVNADATAMKLQESFREEKSKIEALTEKQKSQLDKFESENKELKDENKQLEIGLREILATIKDNKLKPNQNGIMEINIPALEKLIAMIESRNAVGQYDTNLELKGQIENLNGRNEELRIELKNSRNEVNNMAAEIQRKEQKVTELEKEVEMLREAGQGIIKLNPLQLPEGMTPSSADIIASLNEFLIQILQELANKEETLKEYEDNLEAYKRKFSVAMHQQSILYSQYLDDKEQREADMKKLQDDNASLRTVRDQDQIRIQESNRLLDTLKHDPSKQKAKMAEYARKITVLRVNEKSLARRYTILQESENLLRKESNKLKTDITSVENAITERVGYLTRYKEMANYRIAALQKALDNSVPELELQLANKQYNELTAKYRDLLQRENTLISRSTAVENLEFELERLQDVEIDLKKQLQAEKERSHGFEQSLEFYLQKAGSGDGTGRGGSIRQDEVTSIARQLATLEMKELNERQRADHAVRKFEKLTDIIAELENRNSDLEQRFSELSKINLEAQKVERELRDELLNAVPASINLADKKRIEQLEESEAKLKLEMSRLKEVSDIATHQAETILSRQQVQEKELTSLRRQLHDIQMESDEKTIIAKLHQHIVAQQLSEATAVMKMQATAAKVKKLEVAILRVEQQLDEKYQILYRTRMEARAKTRFLKKTIQDLRRQFSGALPLIQQEKFTKSLRELHENKTQQDIELNLGMLKRQEAEEKALQLEMKLIGLQELIVTLKDGKGAEKVTEWHTKMGDMRLQDMKLRRQVEKAEQRIKYLENQNKKLEDSISLMEDEYHKQAKEYEDRQLVWEQHEVELERKIDRLEKNQDELFEAAQKFEEATGSVLDPSLPVANQLEMAIVKLKEHIKTIIITRAESKRMKESLAQAEKKLEESERKITKKDKLINELRLRLPISEREIVLKEGENLTKEDSPEEFHAKNALKVAQSTVESLKVMIKKKEDSIMKYQEMMKTLREEMELLGESHKNEIKEIQGKLHAEMEEKVQKLKKLHLDYINAPRPPVATEKQLNRLADLEEMVTEQDNKLAIANMNYKKAQEEIEKLKERSEVDIKMLKKKMKRREEEHNSEVEKLKREIEIEQNKATELNKEIEILNDDLLAAKEANERAPTKTMKALVERLRNQLALKEKQQKALSQALLNLRRDMVSQAEENVTTHAKKAEEELNVQKIVEKHTSALEERIEELQSKQDKLKAELKQKRESEQSMKAELSKLKRDNERKEAGVKKLAVELKGREEMQDQIEDLKAEIKSLEKHKLEAEKLRKRIEVLEEERQVEIQNVDTMQTAAEPEFPVEKDEIPTKDKKSREEVIRWEESKKWQKRIESFKGKLKEKTEEFEKAEKSIQMMKDIIARNDKEKAAFQAKLKSSMRPVEDPSHIPSSNKEEIIQGLKGRIFQLEEENNDLQRRLTLDKDSELHESRIKNSQLLETVKALESELARKEAEENHASYNWSVSREQSFQKEVLAVRKENMELKFENERAQANLPRLKARVKDLEEYCEILKSELEAVKKREKQKKTAMGTGMGGQSVEDLERVIAAMRRVIERLQGENDNLKRHTGKSKIPPHSDIARENRQLKQEIQKLKSKDGGELSARTMTTNKLVQENDRIRRELNKNIEEIEKLRNANSSVLIEKENIGEELKKVKEQLALAEARAPKLEGADSEQWKSVVMTKIYEEKVGKIESELDKKNKLLQDLKNHLRSAAEREAELIRKEDEYKEKISLLERFPSDIKIDSDVVQHLQRARLRINTLEAEKNELLDDVSRLRELSNDGKSPISMEDDEVLNKLKKYDKLLSLEVELRMKLKTTQIEMENIAAENLKLKKELEAFDPAFFEEIEDLKYNYKKSVERNVLYERQLKQFSRNFGVDVNIPDDDDY